MSRPFLTARWINLAMLNYEVDPATLAAHVPRGTELDSFAGRCFVSVVGFLFLGTRVMGLGVPFHRDFEELNLRFYVRREVAGELRRGVVFIKEIVSRRAIAWVARTLYNENYVAHPMSHVARLSGPDAWVGYRWRAGGRAQQMGLRPQGSPEIPAPTDEAAFIAEHYWGYARQRDGATVEYRVEHPPWRVWRAGAPRLDCDAARLYGSEFAGPLAGSPSSAFLAEGSPVVVYRGRRLQD